MTEADPGHAAALRDAFAAIARSSLFSDAMDKCGLATNASGGWTGFALATPIVGRAHTVRQVAQPDLPGGKPRHGAEIAATPAGGILVIAAPENCGCATWGDAHTSRALIAGLAGVVIGCAVRDAQSLPGLGLPILARGTSPSRSTGRLATGETGGRVELGGVTIEEHDLVCIDADGIAAIPRQHESEVLARARTQLDLEAERDRDLARHLSDRAR